MTREEIKNLIPHREPMLLVDEAEKVGDTVFSQYTIREDEFFTQGHFPGYPVVPGVVLCEIMAQGSALLVPEEILTNGLSFYAGLDNIKFKHSVFPGDTVCVESTLVAQKGPLIIVEAKATVNEKLCCKGKLSFMVVPKADIEKK